MENSNPGEHRIDDEDRRTRGELLLPPVDRVRDVAVDPDEASVRTTAGTDQYAVVDLAGTSEAAEAPELSPDQTEGSELSVGPDEEIQDPDLSAIEYVDRVAELAASDPAAAGDRIGDLIVLATEGDGELRHAASETIEWIGSRRRSELLVWADDFAALADDTHFDLAFVGLRSLAQLAPENEAAAAKGLDAALGRLDVERIDVRTASLALVAEIGPEHADRVAPADRSIAGALDADAPRVRTAAAIAAGKLLAADPHRFPRTIDRLSNSLDDSDETARAYAHVALVNFALEQPTAVPDKPAAIEALEATSDEELGLTCGTVDRAIAELAKALAGLY